MRRTLFRFTVTAIALITLGSGCGDGATTEEPGAGDPSGADPAGETTGTVPPAPSVVHVSMAPTIDGVIAYYALDGDAMDGGPEAIDGVIVGTSGVADRFGIPDGAIAFSSLDDYIHFPEAMLAERLASMTLSLWFQTSADDRGVLFDEGVKSGPGFQFRMQPGKDVFAARSGGLYTLESESAYNDGGWHHAVATAGPEGSALWIDGALVASTTDTYEQAEVMTRLPVLGRQGNATAEDPKDSFVGALDDVALYDRALTDVEITSLFTEGPPRPPTADAGPNISRFGLQIGLDGSRSTDVDGLITSFHWDFGDGSEGAGMETTHAYAAYGAYTVTLTVTDDDGAQAYDTIEVSVRDPECVTPNCDQVDTWDPTWSQLEMDMLDEVNRHRAAGAECGGEPYPAVPPLEMNEIARVAARLHSLDMAEQNYFEHDNLEGLDPFDRMTNAGYEGPDPWGENIQAGSSTAEDAVASLMTSPGHCRNIMDPEYTVVGLGYALGPESDYYHYWTQCFGGGH